MSNAKKAARKFGGLLLAVVLLTGLAETSSGFIRFEHLAINVKNLKEVADWYVEHMGLRIVSEKKAMIFVGDPDGHFMFELYSKTGAKGSYAEMDHASSHIAFASDNAGALAKKMVAGGAVQLKEWKNPAGDTIINMKDPWGNMIQLVERVKPKL